MSAKANVRVTPAITGECDTMDEAWRRARERLRASLGDDVFNSWFASLRLETIVAGRARFSVSTRFLKSWIDGHYLDKLLAAFAAEWPGVEVVEIFVRNFSAPATGRVALRPDIAARFRELGYTPARNSPTEFAQFIRDDRAKWQRVAREAKLSAQ